MFRKRIHYHTGRTETWWNLGFRIVLVQKGSCQTGAQEVKLLPEKPIFSQWMLLFYAGIRRYGHWTLTRSWQNGVFATNNSSRHFRYVARVTVSANLKWERHLKLHREMEEIIVLTLHKSKFTLSWTPLAEITPPPPPPPHKTNKQHTGNSKTY